MRKEFVIVTGMDKSANIPNEEKKQVPSTAKARIKQLMELSFYEKTQFLPSSGYRFQMGPFIYEVAAVHAGKLRFTARLADVIVKGVNDGVSKIIDPKTGKGYKDEDEPNVIG